METERNAQTLILRPTGKIEGTNAQEFQDDIMERIQPDDQALIINLGEVSYISSAGLRIFAMTNNHAAANNIRFALCSPSVPVTAVFKTSGLYRIITIHESEQKAVQALEAE